MAGRHCTVCFHPDREQLDAAILARTPFRSIAARYGMSDVSLIRHRNGHMAEQLAAAVEARRAEPEAEPPPGPHAAMAPADPSLRTDAAAAIDIVSQLKAVNAVVLRVLADARAAGDGRLVLQAADRVQRQIELQAKLLGELDDRPTVNVLVSPEWLAIEAALVDVLVAYPEARYAVAARLDALRAPA
jgi:hypothetical protein